MANRLGSQGTRPRLPAWLGWSCVGLLGVAGYSLLLPADAETARNVYYSVFGILAVVAIAFGIRLNGPTRRLPWYLIIAGESMLVVGDGIWNYYEVVLKVESPFPSFADAVYLGAYMVLAAGLGLLIRARTGGNDAGGFIDAIIVAVGVGVVSWVYLMEPYAGAPSMSLSGRVVSVFYPLVDVMLLALLARLLLSAGTRPPSFYLMTASVVLTLFSDTVYAVLVLNGTYQLGNPVDYGWLLSFTLWGAATLHPSMRALSEPASGPQARLGVGRIVLLAAASLLAPGVLAVEYLRGNDPDVPVIVGGSAVLFLLSLVRVNGLVRMLSVALQKYQRAVDRETILRKAASDNASALDREAIYLSTLKATQALLGNPSLHTVAVALGSRASMSVVAAVGPDAAQVKSGLLDLEGRSEPGAAALSEGGCVTLKLAECPAAGGLLPVHAEEVCSAPLVIHDEVKGAIVVVSADAAIPEEAGWGLETLATQTALALESVALAEDLHRRQSEERLQALVQNTSDVIMILEADGTTSYVSPSYERVLGHRLEDMVGNDSFLVVHPDDVARVERYFARVLEARGVHPPLELRVRHANGSWRHMESIANNLLDDPNIRGVVVNSRDITERKEADRALREAEEKYRTLIEQIPAITYVEACDEAEPQWKPLYVSPQVEDLLGYPPEEWLTSLDLWTQLLHPDDRGRVMEEDARTEETGEPFGMEYRMFARDGRVLWIHDEAVLVRDDSGRPLYWQGVMYDITKRKALEGRLEHQAFHDSLTGLPNRALFAECLARALASSDAQGGKVAVLFVDLDDFKSVNDSLGHWAGDGLLERFARRLEASVRPGDTVARFGGDEFAILLEGATEERAVEVAERVIEELRGEPFVLGGREILATPSVGVALSGDAGRGSEDLLRMADLALHQAKEEGKARHARFTPDLEERLRGRLGLEGELRRALEREELEVFYQPKVSIGTGEIVGMEALVRWPHPERGLLAPSEFLAAAEDTGLIVPIGEWVLGEACRQAREWQGRCPQEPPLAISVNLSAKQFGREDLAEYVGAVLRESGLDPRALTLEITEQTAMEDAPATAKALRNLKAMGVRIEVDDFGTGYSSLSYLRLFPVDYLKVDRSFVGGLGWNPNDEGIVGAIIELAHTLGLEVVAEGVENGEQLGLLREMGCELAQGFYFWGALPAEAAGELLAAYNDA